MKKATKALSAAILSIFLIVFAVSLSACFSTPDSGDSRYNVVINKAGDGSLTPSAFSEIVAGVRTACVDVYAGDTFGRTYTAGSGVIFDKSEDGREYYVITNHHVILDKTSFTVTLLLVDNLGNERNEDYDAVLLGSSKKNDIAVLKIDKKGTESIGIAPFGDSDEIQIGDDVFAIGNPLGTLGGTVSKGIISAKARSVYLEDVGTMTLLQTDAATYEGSSGGALFDREGKVIGITNSGYSQYDGLNFAIPANEAIAAARSLLETSVRNADGSVREYGIVPGENRLGINTNVGTCYKSSSTSETTTVVFVESLDGDSDLLNKGIISYAAFSRSRVYTYFHAITSIEYAPEGGDQVRIAFTSSEQTQAALASIPAGTVVNISFRRINYTYNNRTLTARFSLGQTEVKQVTTTQYRYEP